MADTAGRQQHVKTSCESFAVPAVLQPQQSVVTGETGPDAINVGKPHCPGSVLSTERSGDASRPIGGPYVSRQVRPGHTGCDAVSCTQVPRHPVCLLKYP